MSFVNLPSYLNSSLIELETFLKTENRFASGMQNINFICGIFLYARMKKFVPLLGYYLTLILILFIHGDFLPPLDYNIQLSNFEEVALRFFASFSYYDTSEQYFFFFGSSLGLLCVCLFLLIVYFPSASKAIFSYILGWNALCSYFFWIIGSRSTEGGSIPRFTFPEDFILRTLFYFGSMLVLGFLWLYLLPKWINRKQKTKAIPQKSLVYFECPVCEAKYLSNVRYCLICKKKVTVFQKTVEEEQEIT